MVAEVGYIPETKENMMKKAAICAVVCLAAGWAAGGEKGTAEEAKALLDKAVKAIETQGEVKALVSFNDPKERVMRFGDWSTPVNVGAPLNTAFNDMYAVVSRNGLTVYFTSDRPGGLGGDDLWVSHRDSTGAPWGTPENLTILNSTAADSLSVFNTDGTIMYFNSTRPGGCGLSDLWTSRLVQGEWTAPENMGCVINSAANEQAPAFYAGKHHETTMYFGSNRAGGIGDFDVYKTTSTDKDLADASFGIPVLVPELSSPKRDTRTWVRRDGLEIFITSDRLGGTGLIDMWVATRADADDVWSTPTNVGTIVNSAKDDGSPALSKDGTTLHFFSNRDGGLGLRDIYVTERARLEDDDDSDDDDSDNNHNNNIVG